MKTIAEWPAIRFWIVFAILLGVVALLGWAIFENDAALKDTCTKGSAALEWVGSPAHAQQIVESWRKDGAIPIVRNGILIDFAFIGAYVLCLIVALKRCVLTSIEWWSDAGAKFVWWAVIGGVLDVIENSGILLELYAGAYGLAPVIATVAIAKWVLLLTTVVFILFSGVLAWREWAARDDASQTELKRLDTTPASPRSS